MNTLLKSKGVVIFCISVVNT